MKQIDDLDRKNIADAEFTGGDYTSKFVGDFYLPNDTEKKNPISKETLRWSEFRRMPAEDMLQHVQFNVFPFLKNLKWRKF